VFSGQYQQEPSPPEGAFFKRSMFEYYDGPLPKLHLYGASDYAVTEGGGDTTEHGVIGMDYQGHLYGVDWWTGQTGPDVWIDKWLDLVDLHKPLAWGEENGQILKSVGPFLVKRARERNISCHRVQYTSAQDKPTRARAIQAYLSMRPLRLPRTPWAADLIDECLKFPHGKMDNKVDVLSLIGRMLNGLRAGDVPDQDKKSKAFDELTVSDFLKLD